MKTYSMDQRVVFGKEREDYVLLVQREDDAVPHMTGICATDPMELQDLVNLLNICPQELIERAKLMTYNAVVRKAVE